MRTEREKFGNWERMHKKVLWMRVVFEQALNMGFNLLVIDQRRKEKLPRPSNM